MKAQRQAVVLLLLGAITHEQYVAAIKIPDYWEDERYQGTYTWFKADDARISNETAWEESAPDGYKEQDIMADSVIGAERAKYGQTRVVSPYLVQLDSQVNIPDYWEDERYDPNYTWAAANNPRYGNEESWAASAPDGYKEQNIMSANAIAATEAQWGQTNTNQPYLMQSEADIRISKKWPKNADGQPTGVMDKNQERVMGSDKTYHDDSPTGYVNHDELAFDSSDDRTAEQKDQDEMDEQNRLAAALAAESHHGIMSHPPVPRDKEGNIIEDDDEEDEDFSDADPAEDDDEPIVTAAQISNQQHLYHQMARRTYPEWDSESYLEPYNQSEHAWTHDQYDMSNETHWVDVSAVDGYKIPITADDDNSLVQRKRRTYPEWDSESYLEPYNQAEHAWTSDQYDMSNETHWVDVSAVDGYKIPITADDADSLVQRQNH